MIIIFKLEQTKEVKEYFQKLENVLNKDYEDYTDMAKRPFIDSHVYQYKEYYILKLKSIYPFFLDILILRPKIIRWAIKRELQKKGYKGTIKIIKKDQIITELLTK